MRNIFLFIRRYSRFLFFLFLQALCIYFIVSYSKYHHAAFGATANRISGGVNKQYNRVQYYFRLKRTNDSLVLANQRLYNNLRNNFNLPDSSDKTIIDSVRVDSILTFRRFEYLSAKVIANSVTAQNNFIVITGPNVRNFKKDMGVVGVNNNVVGVITEVDGDYAVVMSLLHKDSQLSGRLLKSTETGTLSWSGVQPNYLQFNKIPKSAKVAKGDTVITSGYSSYFPKGVIIGTVAEVKPESNTGNFSIRLKTATDFYVVEYVYAIASADGAAAKRLIEKAAAASTP